MTRALVLAAMVLMLAVPAGAQEGFDGNIAVADGSFDPPDMTIVAGSTIRWTNVGSGPASVTGAGMTTFDSSPMCNMERSEVCLQPGATYTQTFFAPRTVVYRDKITNATGVLRVVAADAAGAPGLVDATASAAPTPAPGASGTTADVTDTTDATAGTGLPRTGGGAAGLVGLVLVAGAAALRNRR